MAKLSLVILLDLEVSKPCLQAQAVIPVYPQPALALGYFPSRSEETEAVRAVSQLEPG